MVDSLNKGSRGVWKFAYYLEDSFDYKYWHLFETVCFQTEVSHTSTPKYYVPPSPGLMTWSEEKEKEKNLVKSIYTENIA